MRPLRLALPAVLVAILSCTTRSSSSFRPIAGAPERVSVRALLGSALVAWTDVAGATGYTVFLSTNGSFGAGTDVDASPFIARGLGDKEWEIAISTHERDATSAMTAPVRIVAASRRRLRFSQIWSRNGQDNGEGFGTSAAIARLLDPQFPAVVIGAPRAIATPPDPIGAEFVFSADPAADSLVVNPDLVLSGDHADSQEGGVVLAAGDVDGDGLEDLFTTASFHVATNGTPGVGRISLLHHGPSGIERGWFGEGEKLGESAFTTAAVGDFDADGHIDVVGGSSIWYAAPSDASGRLYVYRGPGPASAVLYAPSLVINGDPNSRLGQSLATGDVDGDGADDVLAAEPNWRDANLEVHPRVLGFRGHTVAGLDSSASWVMMAADAYRTIVSPTGDFNGDGFADFLIGSPDAGTTLPQSGLACIWMGSSTGPVAGPCLKNGIATSFFGSAIAVGDFNGDGYADAAIAADGVFNISIFSGSPSGLSADPQLVITPNSLNTSPSFLLFALKDVFLDGTDDLLISDPSFSAPFVYGTGRALLFDGFVARLGGPIVQPPPPINAVTGVPLRPFGAFVSAEGPLRCRWNWGDGTAPSEVFPCTNGNVGLLHSWGAAGDFPVVLHVEDDAGLTGEAMSIVHVRSGT